MESERGRAEEREGGERDKRGRSEGEGGVREEADKRENQRKRI